MRDYVWLTEASQLFLERDYLVKGQTVDERVDIICNNAEKILKKPGFAKKFKENLKKGWYSLSTPIWSNFGTKRALPISCVAAGTWINTKKGGGKKAEEICIGDEVLTHKGRWRKVTKVIPTKNRADIYKLKVNLRMTPLYLTGDHKVLTNLGWVRVDELDKSKHLVATNGKIELENQNYSIDLKEFTHCDHLEKDGRLFKTKANSKESISYCASPKSNIIVDKDLAWAIGLWFAEGSLCVNSKGDPNGIRITNNINEKEMVGKWLDIIKEKFGINGSSYDSEVFRNGKKNNWLTTNVNSNVVGNLFESFGVGCKKKTIPQWIMGLPNEIIESFLEGILDGDGCLYKSGKIKITLANPKLILQLYQIGLKLGKPMSLQMQEKAGKLSKTRHVHTLIFLKEVDVGTARFANSCVAFKDGLNYCRIRALEKIEKTKDVYDFTVEEDHSFSAAGVVLHNCFGSYMEDSTSSIAYTHSEVMMMTKHGGGTSGYFGELRSRGSKIGQSNGESSGSVHFMQLFDLLINVISQGRTRRGNFAAYLPIDHKDVNEFLKIRTEGSPIQDLSYGVCVPDAWMKSMISGDAVKRKIWAKVLEQRANTGYPYIIFIDNANKNKPTVYKDKGMEITHSNLCTEIFLPDSKDEAFVCDLSSMNVLYYEDWKDTDAVELLTYFLDAVMTEFIEMASKIDFMDRAVRFAKRHRALGIGWIGWHSFLQSKMIPFESMDAKFYNVQIAKNIMSSAYKASEKLAKEYGEPEVLKGYGRRNTTLGAIAPTKSSAFIMGQMSEATEPHRSNYFIKDLQKGKFTIKNRHLEQLLKEKNEDRTEVWQSILKNSGSVQHLPFLSDKEKNVFKTFAEISPKEIIIQASQRQEYIDQGQSINLMIHPSVSPKEVNKLIIEAWELGIVSLYYQISVNAAQQFSRNILSCASCEG